MAGRSSLPAISCWRGAVPAIGMYPDGAAGAQHAAPVRIAGMHPRGIAPRQSWLVGEFDGARLADAETRALARLAQTRARRLLIDLTGPVMASQDVATGLPRLVLATQLLGAEVALVGIRPDLALALVESPLETVPTFCDLQSALH